MEVNGTNYEIEDLNVIRLVKVNGNVVADYTPSTAILNQHALDDFPLPQEVITKLTKG